MAVQLCSIFCHSRHKAELALTNALIMVSVINQNVIVPKIMLALIVAPKKQTRLMRQHVKMIAQRMGFAILENAFVMPPIPEMIVV